MQHGCSINAHYFATWGFRPPQTAEGDYMYTAACMHVIGTNSIILYSKKFIQTSHVQPDFISHTDIIPIQVLIT